MSGENRSSLVFECPEKTGNVLLYASISVLFERMLLSLDSGKPGFGVGNLTVISAAEEGN